MRGERRPAAVALSPRCGSSPHARGTRVTISFAPMPARIIPACAGNAPTSIAGTRRPADHPRMRGERPDRPPSCASVSGSSPHARGTRLALVFTRVPQRIIPACAGNARWPRWCSRCAADHPRMREERAGRWLTSRCTSGSSPHARGTLPATPFPLTRHRIIPACAGNAPPSLSRRFAPPDHPRMRGERFPRHLPR